MHRLSTDLYTDDGWNVIKKGDDSSQAITDGTNFMIGNGYLGYRATLAMERKKGYAGCIVSDTWDKADGKWEELSTVPNALYLSIDKASKKNVVRTLDLKKAMTRQAYHLDLLGVSIVVEEEKFASIVERHVIMMRYTMTANEPICFELVTGIDQDVWSLNGNHLQDHETFNVEKDVGVRARTVEKNDLIVVLEKLSLNDYESVQTYQEAKVTGRSIRIKLDANRPYVIEKAMIVVTSNDSENPLKEAVDVHARLEKYDQVAREHIRAWKHKWDLFDMRLTGPMRDQVALRFNAYHQIIATPTHRPLPIGARGMSCQAYQGAAFWDQEIYSMPMFLHTEPEIARNILLYRYLTLPGAKRKAKKHGFEGAFYAWISGKTGDELCPDFFFKDVLTKRDIRNHFNLWQIHISSDIAYAIDRYYTVTKDEDFMIAYGIEMMIEISRFIASRVCYMPRRERYELLRVQGPDEYHENVDNNAFTNYQAHETLKRTLAYLAMFDRRAIEALCARLKLGDAEIELWKDILVRLYVPEPKENGLLEQFDGYFDLESITPAADVRKRLIDPEEYYGWPTGIAVFTQVIKQADVIQLFALHPNLFPIDVQRANYAYYEPRTLHFSSLSRSTYAIVAARIGLLEEAYEKFEKAVMIDLLNTNESVSGGTFIGGIHTAANGASWQMVVYGFIGLRFDGDVCEIAPRLPDAWDDLCLSLVLEGVKIELEMSRTKIRITPEHPASNTRIKIYDVIYDLAKTIEIRR